MTQGYETKVSSFDELARFHGLSLTKWDEDNYVSENTQLAKDLFDAGQQSKQAEIDELQNKYDAMNRAFTVADDCRKEWYRCYVDIRQREDEMKKRIDELEWFVKSVINWDAHPKDLELNSGSWGVMDFYRDYAIRILKGE